MPPIDDATAAAEIAADAATVAANAALAAEAAAEPQIDPNALLAADVEIARIEGETERARIEARAETRIAELNAEEPAWLNDMRASLARMEAMLAMLQSSTPPTTAVTMVAEPAAPVVVENAEGGGAPAVVETETQPAVEPSEQQAEAPVPAPRRPRWI